MNELAATLIVVALFVLRLVVPLVLTIGICMLMNRWACANDEESEPALT